MLVTWPERECGFELREANHRTMNMFAILLAMFRRDFSRFSDRDVRVAVMNCIG